MFFHFSGQLIVIAIFDGVDIPEEGPWVSFVTTMAYYPNRPFVVRCIS